MNTTYEDLSKDYCVVKRFKMHPITVAVWGMKKVSSTGKEHWHYNATCEKCVKNQESGEWVTTYVFKTNDVPLLRKCLDWAFEFMHERNFDEHEVDECLKKN